MRQVRLSPMRINCETELACAHCSSTRQSCLVPVQPLLYITYRNWNVTRLAAAAPIGWANARMFRYGMLHHHCLAGRASKA